MLVFDNATGVGRRICEKVMETELFSRFRAHYGFQIRFCNPQAGWEKGSVENKVGTIRRNLFVPIPTYHDAEEFNKELLEKHKIKAAEKHYKKGLTISELFKEDKKHFLPLPRKPFNVIRYDPPPPQSGWLWKHLPGRKTLLLHKAGKSQQEGAGWNPGALH